MTPTFEGVLSSGECFYSSFDGYAVEKKRTVPSNSPFPYLVEVTPAELIEITELIEGDDSE